MDQAAYDELYQVEMQHWWYRGLHDLVLKVVAKYGHGAPLNILDIGCGTGGLLQNIAAKGHSVTGVDVSAQALDYCKKRGLVNVHQADINTWYPASAQYDVITCLDVLYHSWIKDDVAVLKSLALGLKPNGGIILNFPAFPVLTRQHDKVVMTRDRYTKKMLQEKLKAPKLTPVMISYRLPQAFFVLFMKRIFETRKPNDSLGHSSDVATLPSPIVNNLLYEYLKFENRLILRGFRFPFGSSLFAVVSPGDQ